MLIGATILFIGVTTILEAKKSKNWPTAEGKIVSSSVARARTHHRNRIGTNYSANVRYEYMVGGQTHLSDRVAFFDSSHDDPSHVREIVNRYPTGSKVTVRYSPVNSAEAVLETRIDGPSFLAPGMGSLFFIAGLALFIYGPQALQRRRAARSGLNLA
jgi:hypothetical protein